MRISWLSWLARSLVVIGAVLIVCAVLWPLQMHAGIRLGLAAMVIAAMATFTRHYLLRTPFPRRYGGIVEVRAQPFAYHVGFAVLIALFSFVAWVLLHEYIAP